MNKSETIDALAGALAKAQGEIDTADKSAKNPFFKSSYADLPSVWAACRKQLSKNGLAVVQRMDTSENGMILESVLMHSSGQWISSTYPVNPVKNDPQGLGSAITYARRYALMALVGVVADDASDDDGNAASGNRPGMISGAMAEESSTKANLTRLEHFKAEGREAAEGGSEVLLAWWKRLLAGDQKNLLKFKDEVLKPLALAADGRDEGSQDAVQE